MSGWHKAFLADLAEKSGVQAERLRFPAPASAIKNADYVLVWMQKAQRSRDNPAIELGFHLANELRLPLLVLFVLSDYPVVSEPKKEFMLKGLKECAADLRARSALFCIDSGEMTTTVARYARRAAILIADEGKLSRERVWRKEILGMPGIPPSVLVETESVIPPLVVSDHQEWSAATLRRKISARLPFFLRLPQAIPECRYASRATDLPSRDELFESPSLPGPSQAQTSPSPDQSRIGSLIALQRPRFTPGWKAGMERFEEFLNSGGLYRYQADRNDPLAHGQSEMSPYLSFGQVSPVSLARAALDQSESAAQSYLEQLVVRRELALNFVLYNPDYARYESAVPDWARKSLSEREGIEEPYTVAELEAAKTDDPYWNAAQMELVLTGKTHNYMRMYWGKRLLSWFPDPSKAFDVAISLNDSYSIDGCDPNGYAGVAWCFGRHDRPWPRRALFGSVRSMVASGLRKKFDIDRYASELQDCYNTRRKELS